MAIFFAIIELIALDIGTRMTRTVTAAVAELHEATRHVDRGDFSHRIPVKSSDQLAELALSFNSMTASIEKLIQEQKEKQRLENELAIAQEVQAQLFPAPGFRTRIARGSWILPARAHGQRRLLRFSDRKLAQADSGGGRHQREGNFRRTLDGDDPLGGSRL